MVASALNRKCILNLVFIGELRCRLLTFGHTAHSICAPMLHKRIMCIALQEHDQTQSTNPAQFQWGKN